MAAKRAKDKLAEQERDKFCKRCLTRLTIFEDVTTGKSGKWCSNCQMLENGQIIS